MIKTVTVKNVVIGEGIPKICVPIVGRTKEEILLEARRIKEGKADLVEWRADWFCQVNELGQVIEVARELRLLLEGLPLLFTFRTSKEGGERELNQEDYLELNRKVAASGLVDLIDVELFTGENEVSLLIKNVHKYGVHVIVSNHDFKKTPKKEEMINRLITMQELGADILKIAVMPTNKHDVLELMEATLEMEEQHATRPLITMSMAGMGAVSRLAGEAFGSAVTFGAAKKASAPGQIDVNTLSIILETLHSSMD